MARKPQKQSIATALGLTAGRVSQLVKKGMPTETVDAAREWYQENIRDRARFDGGGQAKTGGMADAKTREIEANAALKELELARRIGSIVDKAAVERSAYQFGRIIQKSLVDVMPSKVAMELAQMTDPWTIECYLRDKIRAELAAVSKMTSEEVEQHA